MSHPELSWQLLEVSARCVVTMEAAKPQSTKEDSQGAGLSYSKDLRHKCIQGPS